MTQKIQTQWIDETTGMLTTLDVWIVSSMGMCNCVIDTTSVGNVGAGEDDLITFTLPAAQLSDNGDYIKISARWTFAANANLKQVKLKFWATTLYDSTAWNPNDASWSLEGIVVRTGAATQKAVTTMTYDTNWLNAFSNNGLDLTSPTETLSWTVVIKCTGEGVANDDIVQEWLIVTYFTAV